MRLCSRAVGRGGNYGTADSTEELVTLVVVEYAVGNDSVGSLRKYDSLRNSVTVYCLGKRKTNFLVSKKLFGGAAISAFWLR